MEFFGRIDDRVKIRGYRVELSEIVSVLLEQDNVASATVAPHDRAGVPTLAAYVVAKDRAKAFDRSALLAGLKARLPAYMTPAYLDVLDELPMLTTGKVDRKRLPAPVQPLVDEASAVAPPKNPLEAKIAGAWARVFGLAAVGAEQDFFLDLGGHSLLAAQMVAALRDVDLHVAVRDVYAFPTPRRLAEHLAAASALQAEAAPAEVENKRPSLRRKAGLRVAALQALLFAIGWYVFTTPSVFVVPIADDLLRGRLSIAQTVLINVAFISR